MCAIPQPITLLWTYTNRNSKFFKFYNNSTWPHRVIYMQHNLRLWILYIKVKVCLFVCLFVCVFVCLFVPYTNSHFWTNLKQNLHSSPPWSGRDRRVCMVRKCLTFSTFLTFFVGSECRILGTKWLPARLIRDSVISMILAGVSVTSRKWRCSRQKFHVLTGSNA
jgi:hypothetical protein